MGREPVAISSIIAAIIVCIGDILIATTDFAEDVEAPVGVLFNLIGAAVTVWLARPRVTPV